ncbi:MAG: DUF6431 domain-containing protein [Candidatus Dormibacteria bacterium]
MTIVWAAGLDVESYAKLGRAVEIPRPGCPSCQQAMSWWSWYQRDLRPSGPTGALARLWIRRVRCRLCGITHALLPTFALARRLDAVATIGTAVTLAVGGMGMRAVGRELGVPWSTVRSLRKRHRLRAGILYAEFAALAVSLGAAAATYSAVPERAALEAIGFAYAAAAKGFVVAPGEVFGFASAVTGGGWLANNTTSLLFNPPGVRLAARARPAAPPEDSNGP